jgi:EAL domain-containing protein (putative c-di-GMP-specific phosphodiesterase class I)
MAFKTASIMQSEPVRMGAFDASKAPIDIRFLAHRALGSKEIIAFQGIGHWNHVLADWLFSPKDTCRTTQESLERAINLALATHCARAAFRWRSRGFNIDVWITLNAQALLDAKFPNELLTCVRKEQVEPDWLVLEIDEVALAGAGELAVNTLEVLAKLGFKLALCATGAPILAFDKRMRALFSHLKYDGSSAVGLKHTALSAQGRAFARRIQAVRAAGIPVIATDIGSKDRKLARHLIGFNRYQSGRRAKTMTFETALKRLNEQSITARIRRPTLPQAPWNPDLSDQSLEDALIDSLRRTQESMLRVFSSRNVVKASIDTNKAA